MGTADLMPPSNARASFHQPVQRWFESNFEAPTDAQRQSWTTIVRRQNTLLLTPTGSGKTLAAFLAGLDHLFFAATPPRDERLRLLYVSPLKALGVDIERNLSAPIAGIHAVAKQLGVEHRVATVAAGPCA